MHQMDIETENKFKFATDFNWVLSVSHRHIYSRKNYRLLQSDQVLNWKIVEYFALIIFRSPPLWDDNFNILVNLERKP